MKIKVWETIILKGQSTKNNLIFEIKNLKFSKDINKTKSLIKEERVFINKQSKLRRQICKQNEMEVIEIGRQYWGTHSECRLDTLKDEKFFRDIENRLVDLNIYSVGIQ